jgi:transcriptional regulator with XRE-family HTH domain
MIEKCQPVESNGRAQHLWFHIGLRLQSRRVQMGLAETTVASHLGVPLATYQSFEAGQTQTPAALLAQLADFFKVSIFYFFQDIRFGELEPSSSQSEPTAVFTVATDEDRLASLVNDFRQLNRERQQYLLLLARALVQDTKSE